MSNKTIKMIAVNFDDALRVMELLVPTLGHGNVSVSPSAVSERWIVTITDNGVGLAEMVNSDIPKKQGSKAV